jgi:hypothetical protein
MGAGTAQHMGFRMFLVPKPGENKWRLIIDLRRLNKYFKNHKLTRETPQERDACRRLDGFLRPRGRLLHTRHTDRDIFTVNCRGTSYRLAGLPMGWECSIYYFCRRIEIFIRHSREPLPNPPSTPHAYLRTSSPRDRNFPDAICETRDGEAPAYSRTLTTSCFLPTAETQLYSFATASRPYTTASD